MRIGECIATDPNNYYLANAVAEFDVDVQNIFDRHREQIGRLMLYIGEMSELQKSVSTGHLNLRNGYMAMSQRFKSALGA